MSCIDSDGELNTDPAVTNVSESESLNEKKYQILLDKQRRISLFTRFESIMELIVIGVIESRKFGVIQTLYTAVFGQMGHNSLFEFMVLFGQNI